MILRLFLLLYRLAWVFLLPAVLVYLFLRGRRDRDYTRHLSERFGFYGQRASQCSIWIHAVSLGETRSATHLISALLERGERIVLTHFTPAGRRESARLFEKEIASGQLIAVWVPFDMAWCYRLFFRAFRPRIGLTLEMEIWPRMIFSARRAGVPLYVCNGQYLTKSFERDKKGLRLRLRMVQHLAGAFVKSSIHAERFRSIGLEHVFATGELRFDQPIPAEQVQAAQAVREQIGSGRKVVTIASGVEGEEGLFVDVIERAQAQAEAPFFVYVPRAPERFERVAEQLQKAGVTVAKRSSTLTQDLSVKGPAEASDVLVGDSLGEMFFYLALSDLVIVGGGFTPRGAHNVIEPLMLGKPVITGPYTWTIEYPFVEAELAGLAKSVPATADVLSKHLEAQCDVDEGDMSKFIRQHAGTTARTLTAIDKAIAG